MTRGTRTVEGPYWIQSKSWPWRHEEWKFHWGNLALDMLVVSLFVVGVGGAVELWTRKRGGVFRFRLVDFLAAMAITALVLGWLRYHRDAFRADREVIAGCVGSGHFRYSANSEFTGPDWLRRLAGGEKFLPLFHHVTKSQFRVTVTWREDFEQLGRLRFLERLSIEGPIPRELLEHPDNFPPSDSLSLHFSHGGEAHLSEIGLTKAELITSRDVALLGHLPLDSLELWGMQLELVDVEELLSKSSAEKLLIADANLSPQELERLRKMFPGVEITTD